MERWLSKSRVLLGLCGVLLVASLNRQDPMVYGMFLFLAVVSLLGFVVPWLSLRGMTVKTSSVGDKLAAVFEGETTALQIVVERSVWWPAFVVDLETRWEWAGKVTVLSQTVPVIRGHSRLDLGRLVRFPCRGEYKLTAISLGSGFPLGLIRANQRVVPVHISLRVLPRPQKFHWPHPWTFSDDPQGEQTTRRLGQSFELGMLRKYQAGDPLGRVSWRASARIGELVIQHFQQSASPLLRLVTEIPSVDDVGDPRSGAEEAIRAAAGVCQLALEQGVRAHAYLPPDTETFRDLPHILGAMAAAKPGALPLSQALAHAVRDMTAGEQLAVVIGWHQRASHLLSLLASIRLPTLVCIATGDARSAEVQRFAKALQHDLLAAGIDAWADLP